MTTPHDDVGPAVGQRAWPGGPIRHRPIAEMEHDIERLAARVAELEAAMTTPTEHLVRISKLVSRPGQLYPWTAQCGTCDWADAAPSRDEALRAADAHAARPEGR